MAQLKFTMTGDRHEAAAAGRTGQVPPPPGVYPARVIEITDEKPPEKNRRLHVIFELSRGKHKGFRVHDYIVLANEATEWKLDQFLVACQLTETKGKKVIVKPFDPDKPQLLPEVQLRIKHETWQDEPRARINATLPFDPDAEDDDEDDEDDDEEEDDDGEEEDSDDDDDDDDDDEDDEEPENEVPPWEEMSLAELRAAAKEKGIETKGLKKPDLVEALNGAGDEEDEEAEDYDSWEIKDLKVELKERGLNEKGPKSKLVERLEESDAADPFDE